MLNQKDCFACKKGTPALTLEQAAGYLGFVEGWDQTDSATAQSRQFVV